MSSSDFCQPLSALKSSTNICSCLFNLSLSSFSEEKIKDSYEADISKSKDFDDSQKSDSKKISEVGTEKK